ncbi:MAG TPA: zinc-binding dehydrogenase [Limosilactobacillus coleohominis]|nr:zinc-binding dehydrogenase [Limosilactobacillus coleohominis]
MKALVVPDSNCHSIKDLQIMDVPVPTVTDNQVLVKVHAVGLNPVDYKIVESGIDSWTYPHPLGLDVAGEIVAVGSQVNDWQVGDRVSGHGNLFKAGCFAEYVSVPEYQLAKLPENVSYEQAAALLCGALTAYTAINRKPNLTNVKTVLVHGGAGSVGSLAIQFAQLHGLQVLTTVSTKKIPFVRKLNPDAIIDYQSENVDQKIADFTNDRGVDLIIDTVGKTEAERDLHRLAYNGTLVTIVDVPKIDADLMFDYALTLATVNLGGAHGSDNPLQQADLGHMNSEVLALLSDGKINPLIERVLSFDEIKHGLQLIKDHRVTGKLVAKITG